MTSSLSSMLRAVALGLFVFASAASAQYAPQSAGSEPLEPALEARVLALGKQLRCATCQGLSITDSPASMARSQLDMVRELVKEGRSDEEIKQFFVERFGEWALLKPRTDPTTALLWAGPVVLLLGGIAFVFWFSFRNKVSETVASASPDAGAGAAVDGADGAAAANAANGAAADSDEDPYLSAVRRELNG